MMYYDMQDRLIDDLSSPDGRQHVVLTGLGGIGKSDYWRYALTLNDHKVAGLTIIGSFADRDLDWSPDGRFVMMREWLETGSDARPLTGAVLIDTDMLRFVRGPAENGIWSCGFGFAQTPSGPCPYWSLDGDDRPRPLDLQNLQWEPLDFSAAKPAPSCAEPPFGPIDEQRLRQLLAALPLLKAASKKLAAAGNDVAGSAEFRSDAAGHLDSLARNEAPRNPITFDRLGGLSAYPYRLEQQDPADPLAGQLHELIWSLDILGRHGGQPMPEGRIEQHRASARQRLRQSGAGAALSPAP